MPIRDGAAAHGDLDRERKRDDGGEQTRAAPAPLPGKFQLKCLLLRRRQSGIFGRTDGRANDLAVHTPTLSAPCFLNQAALLRSRHSPKFTRTAARPSLLARSRHSGFFHGLPPTEKTAGDPYFIFPADLKRTLLTPSLSHHFGLPEMGWRPLSKMCHFCNVGEKKDGSLEPRFDCSVRHYFDTFLRPLPPFEMLKRQISEIRCAA